MKNDKNEEDAIIIFVKNPVPGKVKTRLAATTGEKAALDVYVQLIDHLKSGIAGTTYPVFIFYSDYIEPDDFWPVRQYTKEVQSGNDLGERMSDAFNKVLFRHKKAVLIGSDCPLINTELLKQALLGLDSADVVIGPAADGGYYLIGMNKPCDMLFKDIHWSTEDVFEATLRKAEESFISVHQLTELRDVDDENDFLFYVNQGVLTPPGVS